MTLRGTVFKIKPRSLIVATKEFEFKEVSKHQEAQPGQEITFKYSDIIQSAAQPRRHKKKTILAMIASFLLISMVAAGMFRNFLMTDIYAYISMDINPSIELAVNKYMKVSQAEAKDAGAEEILQHTSLSGLEINQAVSAVLKACTTLGYIDHTTSDIMITTTINPTNKSQAREKTNNWTKDLEKRIILGTEQELQEKSQNVNVYIVDIEPEERTQALNHEVSAGRYYLWHKAKEQNPGLSLNKINTQSISASVNSNENIRSMLDNSCIKKWSKPAPVSASENNKMSSSGIPKIRVAGEASPKPRPVSKPVPVLKPLGFQGTFTGSKNNGTSPNHSGSGNSSNWNKDGNSRSSGGEGNWSNSKSNWNGANNRGGVNSRNGGGTWNSESSKIHNKSGTVTSTMNGNVHQGTINHRQRDSKHSNSTPSSAFTPEKSIH